MVKFKSFMEEALSEARKAAKRDEVPVGAVIVNQHGRIVAKAGNRIRELTDPTAHAEILTIRQACKDKRSERLIGHHIYVTLEPCNMCLQAILNARISKLYYGASDTSKARESSKILSETLCQKGLSLEIYPNINEDDSEKLLKAFFITKR